MCGEGVQYCVWVGRIGNLVFKVMCIVCVGTYFTYEDVSVELSDVITPSRAHGKKFGNALIVIFHLRASVYCPI